MTAKRISALFLMLCLAVALSSCGRTGKLYLPENTAASAPVSTPEAQPQSSVQPAVNKSESKTNE